MRGMDTKRKNARPEGRAQGSCEGTALDDSKLLIAVALLLASGLVAWLVMVWG